MNKLVVSTLATTPLLLAAGISLASPQADLGLDPSRLFFRWTAPGVDTGDFRVQPDGLYNTIVLPCDVQMFGGMLDINYLGAGPTVFPKLTITLFNNQTNAPISSSGCQLTSLSGPLGFPMTAGSTAPGVGYTAILSSPPWCPWLFLPSDLPVDTVVRMHLEIAAYGDDTYQGLVGDPNPANNGHDLYLLRRSCTCQ